MVASIPQEHVRMLLSVLLLLILSWTQPTLQTMSKQHSENVQIPMLPKSQFNVRTTVSSSKMNNSVVCVQRYTDKMSLSLRAEGRPCAVNHELGHRENLSAVVAGRSRRQVNSDHQELREGFVASQEDEDILSKIKTASTTKLTSANTITAKFSQGYIDLGSRNFVEEGSASLAFVFDTTGSMSDDLKQVIEGAGRILRTVLEQFERPIHNYIFVPFHDPGEYFAFCMECSAVRLLHFTG